MSNVRFRDVKVGEEFGHTDYFFTKVSELTATFSGDLFTFPLDEEVFVEDEPSNA